MRASSELGLVCPEIELVHTKAKFVRRVNRRLAKTCTPQDTGAQMVYDEGTAIVLMEYQGNTTSEITLLVHESYHVARAHMDWLGEDSPGEEVMAYLIQTIAHALLEAHGRWRAKRGLV